MRLVGVLLVTSLLVIPAAAAKPFARTRRAPPPPERRWRECRSRRPDPVVRLGLAVRPGDRRVAGLLFFSRGCCPPRGDRPDQSKRRAKTPPDSRLGGVALNFCGKSEPRHRARVQARSPNPPTTETRPPAAPEEAGNPGPTSRAPDSTARLRRASRVPPDRARCGRRRRRSDSEGHPPPRRPPADAPPRRRCGCGRAPARPPKRHRPELPQAPSSRPPATDRAPESARDRPDRRIVRRATTARSTPVPHPRNAPPNRRPASPRHPHLDLTVPARTHRSASGAPLRRGIPDRP